MIRVLKIIIKKINGSKYLWLVSLNEKATILEFVLSILFTGGDKFNSYNFIDNHSFYLSVNKKFLPNISFYSLNVETTTPTNTLAIKKLKIICRAMK